MRWVGWGNGSGYPGKSPNPACRYMGIGTTYSCACGVSMNFGHAGFPLISMQAGYKHGYTYCPSGLSAARAHHAVIRSWNAQPADILFINTGGGAQPGHTEMVVRVWGSGSGRMVRSLGWDSGPSNVTGGGGAGQGGVHLHDWRCPEGSGNSAIMGVGDAAKLSPGLAKLAGHPAPHPHPGVHHHPSHPPRQPLTKNEVSQVTSTVHQLRHVPLPLMPGNHGIRELRKLESRIHAILRHTKH